ncbi:MAG: LacI family DNA-binding transcriptional regulator [Dactylosporangium sp.]|nr:LacI family transcriptional regulator [Dactylosporangium sp.]NNJ63174.1 LacI family DNA-binding transcriptional regulator [Dactylosporangium sp.]
MSSNTGGSGRARLADIAKQAGVSEATVSRALNDKPGVSEAARGLVLTALDVLGFERPERLRKRSVGLVGLVIPELENPIFPTFAQMIETSLSQHGFTPVLCTQTPGGTTEDEYVEMLLTQHVSGIIFVSSRNSDTTADPTRYRKLVDGRLPIVGINGYVKGVEAPFFSCDDRIAGEHAVRHLADLGHCRIGFISGPRRFAPVQRRFDGYTRTMRELFDLDGPELVELTEYSPFGVEGGHASADRLLDRGVTGLVCGSDLMALGAIRAARNRGLAVPTDFSVVGHDDSPLMPFTDPPMTTLRQPVREIALAAVTAVVDEIGGHPAPHSEYLFRPELVVRGTTGPCPC